MFEESASEIWESIHSWFTPTVLFILLNLMIATIVFTSALANQKRQHNKHKTQQNSQNQQPSVIQRIKSINFYSQYRYQEPQNLSLRHKQNPDSDSIFGIETHSNYIFQDTTQEHLQIHTQIQNHYHERSEVPLVLEEKGTNSDDFQGPTEKIAEQNEHSINEVYSQQAESHFIRSRSETIPASGDIQAKIMGKMRKWASLKSDFGHSEDEDAVRRRPATMREKRNAEATHSDEEVDAKADDFINKFKQQLKLQRMDSIIRYNEDAI